MSHAKPGEAVPTDPAAEFFRFRHGVLQGDDDPRFRTTWERAIKVGQRVAIERTASWAGLVPLLQDVLDYLIETAIEKDAAAVELSSVGARWAALQSETDV